MPAFATARKPEESTKCVLSGLQSVLSLAALEDTMNILGIIFLSILLICVWRGYARGLFRSVLIVGAMVLAMVLSAYATPYVSRLLQQYTVLDETIEDYIAEQLLLDIDQEINTKNEQMLIIEELPFPDVLKLAIVNHNNSEVYEGLDVLGFQEYLAHYLSCVVMNCLAFIFVQLLITIGLIILLSISKVLTEIPILHGIDKTGGVILGIIQTLAIIWTLFILISLIGNTPFGIAVFKQIIDNPVLSFLYEHNWLLDTVTSITNIAFI